MVRMIRGFNFLIREAMKKLFTMILIAAAVVGCSTDINEDMSVKVGPRYTAAFAVDLNETECRCFDADLD